MADDILTEQATEVATILPRLTRRFNVLMDGDPAMDLPLAQLRLCANLRDGSRSMSCLAKELGISLSAVTQMADRLERAELVERIPEADDRRVKFLRLTRRGDDLMRARRERKMQRIRETLESLSPEARQQAIDGLRILLSATPACVAEVEEDVSAAG